MKKSICLAALFSVLLLTACSERQTQETGKPFDVYYINRDETKIVKETYYIDSDNQDSQTRQLITAMQVVPQDVSLKPVVGTAFTIRSFRVEEGQITLDVNEGYRTLTPTTEVLVRAALVRTLTQVDNINHVLMTVNGEGLTDRSDNTIGPMTADAFLDNAGEEINSYEKVRLQLYFADNTGNMLVQVPRNVIYNSNISMEKLVVEQVIKGPLEGEEAFAAVNPATKVISVTTKDGICYVNLDDAFLTPEGNTSAEAAIYAITDSLVELQSVNKVQIAISGKTNIMYRETVNIASVFERNLDIIAPAAEQAQTQTVQTAEEKSE